MANQSVYSATIERRTVMSSGFPPKTQMKLISVFEGKVNQRCGPCKHWKQVLRLWV